jgi:hypothetical protein
MKHLIAGPSGSGKTTSLIPYDDGTTKIIGLNPKETFFISCGEKVPPVRKFSTLYPSYKLENGSFTKQVRDDGVRFLASTNADTILKTVQALVNTPTLSFIKYIVIDDMQYIQSYAVITRAKEKGFDKFVEFAKMIADIIMFAGKADKNKHLIFTYHDEKDDDGTRKLKTAGKFIESSFNILGLMDTILWTNVTMENNKRIYRFQVNSDGVVPAKSMLGLFDTLYIPNDMGYVMQRIEEFTAE